MNWFRELRDDLRDLAPLYAVILAVIAVPTAACIVSGCGDHYRTQNYGTNPMPCPPDTFFVHDTVWVPRRCPDDERTR